MQKQLLIAASVAGLLAVVLGAFGAHSLKPFLTEYQLAIWEKGVQYQFYHALALLSCGFFTQYNSSKKVKYAAYCFIAGIIGFSGSLYLLATINYHHLPTIVLGPVTPLGGLLFIAGWGTLVSEGLSQKKN